MTHELTDSAIEKERRWLDMWRAAEDEEHGDGCETVLTFARAVEAAVLAHLAQRGTIWDVICDGFAVYSAMNEREKKRTSAENVCDVLDAVARLVRAASPEAVQPTADGVKTVDGGQR